MGPHTTFPGGHRVQVGWHGEWSCSLCGRSLSQDDPLALPSAADPPDVLSCPADGPRTLVVDLAHNSRTWLCFPGCTCEYTHSFETPRQSNFVTAGPPATNHEGTNSFLYCPILLHVADLLQGPALEAWCQATPWFASLCSYLAQQLYDVAQVTQAYSELIEISGGGSSADMNVVAQLRALTNQYPAGTRIGIRCLVPAVVDHSGHIPNLLQDLVLQMYGGLQLASEVDRAVTYFREQGNWPSHLSHLPLHNPFVSRPIVPDAPHAAGIPHVNVAPVPVLGPAVRDPGPAACSNTSVGHNPAGNPEQLRVHTRESSTNLQPNSNVALFPTHLHQHACDRRMTISVRT